MSGGAALRIAHNEIALGNIECLVLYVATKEYSARYRPRGTPPKIRMGASDYHPIFQPFTQLAIWDQKIAEAIPHLDRASELLGQSFIRNFQNNLSASLPLETLAELYLEAKAFDASEDRLEDILRVFPANGRAKLVYAKLRIAQGDE